MKRIAFAWITEVIDFDTKEKAIDYVSKSMKAKKYWFKSSKPEECVYENGDDEFPFSVEVRKRYADFYPGF